MMFYCYNHLSVMWEKVRSLRFGAREYFLLTISDGQRYIIHIIIDFTRCARCIHYSCVRRVATHNKRGKFRLTRMIEDPTIVFKFNIFLYNNNNVNFIIILVLYSNQKAI